MCPVSSLIVGGGASQHATPESKWGQILMLSALFLETPHSTEDRCMQSLINQGERPRYAQDDFWRFKYGADDFDRFKSALEHIGDLSLTAEVTRYREASRLFFQYQEEIRKIEERLWQAGQLKDASGRRLEGANALHRIEEALEDLSRRSRVRHGNTRR